MEVEQAFEFELADIVKLVTSNELGEVIGRAEFIERTPQYQVRYCRNDGVQTEAWWSQSALIKA